MRTLNIGLLALVPIVAPFVSQPAPTPGPERASTDPDGRVVQRARQQPHPRRRRLRHGVRRTKGVVRLLDKHDVDVVGLQEMQADQMRSFLDRTDGRFAAFPGLDGEREIDGENSVAWDTSVWDAVEKTTFTIPYFGGNRRAMPLVKLRNQSTDMTDAGRQRAQPGLQPPPRPEGSGAARDRREAELARKLNDTGVPVFLTGDMNEREQAFCPMTGKAPMQAARGGSHQDGKCRAGTRATWTGCSAARLAFSGYVEDRGAVNKRTSDHPIVVSDAHIDGAVYQQAVHADPPPPPCDGPRPACEGVSSLGRCHGFWTPP